MAELTKLEDEISPEPIPERGVLYTCLFGFSEPLNELPDVALEDGVDKICFTDDAKLTSRTWQIRVIEGTLLDAVRSSKRIKILAHRYLSAYKKSLYIDNTVRLKRPATELFEQYLRSDAAPLVCFAHPERSCIYDEATAVLGLGYDDPARVRRQIAHYRSIGYPVEGGLFKGAFLLRRHHDPALIACMESWFEQVLVHSYRDQISMPVVFKQHALSPSLIAKNFLDNDILDWPVLSGQRLPRDFDDLRYLELHPDVKADGMNPRQHYQLHGRNEGRNYR